MRTTPDTRWFDAAQALQADGRAFIAGSRTHAVGERAFEKYSPIDGRHLATVCRGDVHDIQRAVTSARQTFEQGCWRTQPPKARKQVLLRFAEKISAAAHELALLETLDMGKPIRHSLSVDVPATAHCLAWYAESIDKVYGEIAPTGPQALALITREPVGVVGVILPWNYPMIQAAWKIGPALASGNSVVLKPSEKSPLTALRLAELAVEAGLPPGVLNVVPGWGHEAGEALALHPDVDVIAFTGSTATGRRMLDYASRSNLKRVYNELGGKSAAIIFEDCKDLDRAAACLSTALFFNQGQSCNAPSRLLVQRSIAPEISARILAQLPRFSPGHPLDEQTVLGALVDTTQLETVLHYVAQGQAQGAQLLSGGRRALENLGGCYVEPTVFGQVHNGMTLAREEIFGPVLCLLCFDDEADAIRQANDSPYGLQASVWSPHIDRAHRVARALRVGTVHVNQYDEDDITVPFGGLKQSGNSRDKSLHALEKYAELKTTWIQLS